MSNTIQTKELADLLHIKDVTVRKYASALFEAGHDFDRDSNNYRIYKPEDVELFQLMMSIQENEKLSVMRSAEQAIARFSEPSEPISTLADTEAQQEIERLHRRIDELSASVSAVLRESSEIRRMIAAKYDKKWWEFWKKSMVLPDLSDPETVWRLRGLR